MSVSATWRLVVVRLCETVQVVRWLHLEARELASGLPSKRSRNMPLLAGIARSTLLGALPMHVQVGRIHGVALHVRAEGVHLVVIGRGRRVAHQIVVHKICVTAGHRVLIQRLLRVVDLGALVHDRVRYAHGLALRVWPSILFAGSSLILLLGRATRRT